MSNNFDKGALYIESKEQERIQEELHKCANLIRECRRGVGAKVLMDPLALHVTDSPVMHVTRHVWTESRWNLRR